ncbi:hypothetical protein A3A67_03160 [Candidatus Peribacteria bacterium RIFCSPLOWO2_01_FULL_51_18]|nr:MAG: hypothetical protein A3C52_01130 [Candidatus Peribacteria bacterium RIFCSPHIGHO2_02_FULL_51_15]OGJ66433.1 MAG: hypothetical protein A3A67_03160 [Candidatus Peribacteria bacterium RIFCSPLOWO2_01_FULL_51_18]OGJ68184.1 MAG: hypothetical protein A3J34_00500 [Candidatus Peribacteria bacterium RIFCSPLOWO2_02_FULL_51_10]
MAQYNHLPVFQKTYLLTVEMYGVTSRFPRLYRFTLGEKLKALLSDLLCHIVAANSREDKVLSLEEAAITLEQLRIHVRLASDLKILGLGTYESMSRTLEEISKQFSGWTTWAKGPAHSISDKLRGSHYHNPARSETEWAGICSQEDIRRFGGDCLPETR